MNKGQGAGLQGKLAVLTHLVTDTFMRVSMECTYTAELEGHVALSTGLSGRSSPVSKVVSIVKFITSTPHKSDD